MFEKEEHRRHPRINHTNGMLVAWQTGTRRAVSYMDSMGLGGFFIRTKEPLPVGSLMALLLNLPAGDVRARGIVRRISPNSGMGVEFVAMTPEDRGRLNKSILPYLEDHPPA